MVLYGEILKEFQKHKVQYVIAGGMAVNLLGSMRGTADLDILVAMTDANLSKVVGILKKQGYKVRQPVDPMGIADAMIRRDWIKNKNMKAFNFFKDQECKEVDIIIDSPVSYVTARKNVIKIKSKDLELPVISIKDLITMKRHSGRPQDQLDIEELKWIRKLRRKNL